METTAETSSAVTGIHEFNVDSREIGISWIMRESLETQTRPASAGLVLRSVKYIGTLSVKYLSLPSHAVEFFISLLNDLHQTWLDLITRGNLHLTEVVSSLYQSTVRHFGY